MGSGKVFLMEYLERTEVAGNYINTPIGENKMETPKVKDVVATMTFPSEQLIEMFKDYTMTDDQVEQIIQNYDFEDVIESGLSNHDWNDEVENVLNSIDLEDYLDMDTIASNLDYKDIAREVANHLDEPDAMALADELLSSFNYDSPCHVGSLYIKSVEAIIEGYMKKQTEGIVQPTVIEEEKVVLRSFSILEISEVLDALQYTEYNKSRILTSLSLK
jgi:Ca2+-binding EF-hand superfamily protein